jgi:hypothetical protein
VGRGHKPNCHCTELGLPSYQALRTSYNQIALAPNSRLPIVMSDVARMGALGNPSLVSRSNQTFRLVPTVKLLGIMLRIRCCSTTFHIVWSEVPTDGAKSGWCDQPLGSPPRSTLNEHGPGCKPLIHVLKPSKPHKVGWGGGGFGSPKVVY